MPLAFTWTRILPWGISGTLASPSWFDRISKVGRTALPKPARGCFSLACHRTITSARATGRPAWVFTTIVSLVVLAAERAKAAARRTHRDRTRIRIYQDYSRPVVE